MNIFSNIVTNLEISQYSNYDPQIVLKILPKELFLNARITIIFLQFKKNKKKIKKCKSNNFTLSEVSVREIEQNPFVKNK